MRPNNKLLLLLFLVLSLMIHPLNDPIYKYNTSNGKYHRLSCKWAIKCTTNCIEIPLSEIKKRGGIPCKVCKPQK